MIAAIAADTIAPRTGDARWRVVVIRNLQAGGASAVLAAGHLGRVLVWGADFLRP